MKIRAQNRRSAKTFFGSRSSNPKILVENNCFMILDWDLKKKFILLEKMIKPTKPRCQSKDLSKSELKY